MPSTRLRTLAEDLRRRDDDALAALLRARPDLLAPVASDLASLAARATTRPSVVRALDQLDRFTLQVLEALCVQEEPAAVDALTTALGTAPAAPLALLVEQALVYSDEDGGLYVPRAVRDALGTAGGLGPSLGQALVAVGPARRERLAAELDGPPSAVLADPDRLDALVAEVSDGARAALDALTWGSPTGRVEDATRDVGPTTATTPVEELLARGLLLPADASTVVLPREVALHLRGGRVHREVQVRPPDPVTEPVDRARVDRTAAGAAATVVRQVEDLLELWSAAPPRVLRAGGVGVRDRSRSATGLDVDEPTLTLLVEVAHAAGLLAAGEDPAGLDEVWLPTPAYDDWLREPVAARWLDLVRAWRESPRVAGLVGTVDPRGRTLTPLGPDLERGQAVVVRLAVLDALAGLDAEHATTTASLAERLRWHAPRRGGRLQDDLVGWTVHESQLLGLTSGGALSTAGRLLGAGDPDAAVAALGRALPPVLDHVLLQADLTAVAPGPLEPELTRTLRLVADVESTGGATVYRFTDASVRRAYDAGWTSSDLLDVLSRSSRTPVPQPLAYLVEDVARRHGRVRVGAASSFVRCDDEALLGELVTDRRAAGLRLRRLAPTVVAAQAAADAVLERLRELGYAPAAESIDGDVVLDRPAVRRSTPRRPPAVVVTRPPEPRPALLAAAVSALRAGERSAAVTISRPAADVLAMLTDAAEAGEALWIGYVDAEGRGTQRVVEPVSVEGGQLTAYDHLRGAVRHFAVHRITGVSPVAEAVSETGA